MWKPHCATWVICCALVGAVTVPLLPDAVWPGESSGNSPVLTTRHLSCRIRGKVYEAFVRSAMLHGSKTWGPTELELLRRRNDRAWSIGSVASKTETKHPQLHYYSNLASRTLHQSFTVSDSVGRAMYKGPCPVSNLSQTFHSPALERKDDWCQ